MTFWTGTPTVCVTIWAVLRLHFDDMGYVVNGFVPVRSCDSVLDASHRLLSLRCWDTNDNAAIWWVIKGPVLASIMVRYCSLSENGT